MCCTRKVVVLHLENAAHWFSIYKSFEITKLLVTTNSQFFFCCIFNALNTERSRPIERFLRFGVVVVVLYQSIWACNLLNSPNIWHLLDTCESSGHSMPMCLAAKKFFPTRIRQQTWKRRRTLCRVRATSYGIFQCIFHACTKRTKHTPSTHTQTRPHQIRDQLRRVCCVLGAFKTMHININLLCTRSLHKYIYF